MPRGATCSPISKATTIGYGDTPRSGTSALNKQRQKPHNPVSTFPGEGQPERGRSSKTVCNVEVVSSNAGSGSVMSSRGSINLGDGARANGKLTPKLAIRYTAIEPREPDPFRPLPRNPPFIAS